MRIRLAGATLLALLVSSVAVAQQPTRRGGGQGLRQDLTAQLNDAERKLVALAEATPADKFTWRPAEGVRSVSEVFVHVASANVFFSNQAGVRDTSFRVARDAEKTMTTQKDVVHALKKSFEMARNAVAKLPAQQMDESVDLFGQTFTRRGLLLLMATHAHEHVGQAIAYARMQGITPPWSVANSGDE